MVVTVPKADGMDGGRVSVGSQGNSSILFIVGAAGGAAVASERASSEHADLNFGTT